MNRKVIFTAALILSSLVSLVEAGVAPTAGPDLLRMPPATAPQLTNSGIWSAPPLLVSGAVAYRQGEFIYQDYLYDDHGANGNFDDPTFSNANGVSVPTGTYTYPSGAGYNENAADLVEFRVKPLTTATAFRITLNTLVDSDLAAFTIALGTPASLVAAYPLGANVSGPASLFVTVHGTTAVLTDATTGMVLTPKASVQIDTARSQYTVLVPHEVWNPAGIVTIACGVGLWNQGPGMYLLPGVAHSTSAPGGSGTLTTPAAFFNVAFRTAEPVTTSANSPNYWRENAQATSLASNTMQPFTAQVDLTKLANKVEDDSAIPTTGVIDRIMSSHFNLGYGVDMSISCNIGNNEPCSGQYLAQLQPYNVYVPPQTGNQPYGLTLLLHALNQNYNEFIGSHMQQEFANRGSGVITLTPEARGPDGVYYTFALADTFEAWADAASHYPLEPAWTTISGYSMGGLGTFDLAMEFPDLFAKGMATNGTGFYHVSREPSLRNVPIMDWTGPGDELVPVALPENDARNLSSLGYRFEVDVFPSDHFVLVLNDAFQPAADFLGTDQINSNPAHVTYVVDPLDVFPGLSIAADHAYWISNTKVRTVGSAFGAYDTASNGVIDAFSHGFGAGDPTPSGLQVGEGTDTGGSLEPVAPYVRQYQNWGAAPAITAADVLDLKLTNIGALTIDVTRAGLDCKAVLNVTTDGPVDVTLAGCGKPRHFGS